MTESNPTPVPRFNWRRLFQFRLRTLLTLTTIIAVALGWWSYKARQQREAEVALSGGEGVIFYDFNIRESLTNQPPEMPIDSPDVTDDMMLKVMEKQPFLIELDINGAQITDAGLERLKGLTALKHLVLTNTKVTDAGLEHLKGLTALERLDLNNTKVTAVGVARLQQSLPHCKIRR